ncbi:diguanylate cyclase domain-containing protein [Angustibacter aerolatus]
MPHDDDFELLEQVLADQRLRTVFQPLVDLDSGAVVGYEALTRGPAGTALETPDRLFAAARRHRRLKDLDVACRTTALRTASEAGLTRPFTLFVNAEPEALDGWRPAAEHEALGFNIVVELTERELTARPAQLLQAVARVRELGWGVALDDVGADPASLALLPLVRPDVVKLDLRLVQDRPTADIAAVVNAVHAEAERSGTLVLAEGLETADHVLTARAYGATIGQGWHFARPGDLPAVGAVTAPTERETVRISPRRDGRADVSPFDAVARTRTPRAADKRLLIAVSKHLEAQAHAAGDSAIVLSAFQDVRFLTPATKRRYAALAESCAFVAALGEDVPADPLPGVRGGALTGRDPLLGEWDIAVLGPHFAACLVARDLGDEGPDMERRFEFVLSHDRELTIRVAGSMMTRVWPEPPVADLPQLPVTRVGALPGPRTPLGEATGTAALSEALPGHLLDAPLLQRALDAATTGITVSDARLPGQPLIWVNSAFARLSGQSADEVLGRNCRFLQGPGSDPRVIADISAAIAAGEGIHTRLLNYRQDGTPWWNELSLSPVLDEHGVVTHYIGVQDDVTARVEAEARVTHLAYSDALTGLANRTRLADALREGLERGRRRGSSTALLFVDLDNFKDVNDRLGHSGGDELLALVAERLRSVLRADDLLARQGGDEFLVLLTDLPAQASQVAERVASGIVDALREPFVLDAVTLQVGASVGVSVVGPGDHGAAAELLLQRADQAMYAAKRAGRGSWQTLLVGS